MTAVPWYATVQDHLTWASRQREPEACPHPIEPILEAYGWTGRTRGWGNWKKTRCPFHYDKRPSATVNFAVNAFKCFGCEIKGDTVTLLMNIEQISRHEAEDRAKSANGSDSESGSDNASSQWIY